jgi:hypothetical protein
MTGVPSGTTPGTDTPGTTTPETTITTSDGKVVPRVVPVDDGLTVETGENLTSATFDYLAPKLTTLNITDDSELPNFANNINDQEDISNAIVRLAGDKATEGYDYAQELELVNRYLKQPQQVNEAEMNRLIEANVLKSGTDWLTDVNRITAKTGQASTSAVIDSTTENGPAFAEWLIANNYSVQDRNSALTVSTYKGMGPLSGAEVYNISLKFPSQEVEANINRTIFNDASTNIKTTTSGGYQKAVLKKLYKDFLNEGMPSATQASGYSSFDSRNLG